MTDIEKATAWGIAAIFMFSIVAVFRDAGINPLIPEAIFIVTICGVIVSLVGVMFRAGESND